MVTKELIKAEIDKVPDPLLEALYRIIKALELIGASDDEESRLDEAARWKAFIAETYGSLADAPIERGNQGEYELRDEIQ